MQIKSIYKTLFVLFSFLAISTNQTQASPLLAEVQHPQKDRNVKPISNIEQILNFNSEIHILPDNTVKVTETIEVNALHDEIKHGIYRDFPTAYTYLNAFKTKRGFAILSVKRDGKSEPYHTKSIVNGIRLYIGSKDSLVPTGIHTYTIQYQTDRQIEYNYTESSSRFYYNITGEDWNFPILYTSARIFFDELPNSRQSEFFRYIKPTFYSVQNDETSLSSSAQINMPNSSNPYIQISLPYTLYKGEGLTADIIFPKWYMEELTPPSTLAYFVKDNIQILSSILLLLTMIIVSVLIWKKYGNDEELSDVKIPEYEPPEGLSPEEVGFLNNKGKYDPKQIAALVADLAVKKIIKIEKKKNDKYKITLINYDPETIASLSPNQKLFLTSFTKSRLEFEGTSQLQTIFAGIAASIFKVNTDKFLNDLAKKAVTDKKLSITIGNKYLKYMENIKTGIQNNNKNKILGAYYEHNYRLLTAPFILGLIASVLAFNSISNNFVAIGGFIPIFIFTFFLFNLIRSIVFTKGYKKISSVIAYLFIIVFLYNLFAPIFAIVFMEFFGHQDTFLLISPEMLGLTIIIASIIVFITDFIVFQKRTSLGTQIQNKIEGLKLFLTTTEERRYSSDLHKEIPHTMDVYEKYLPYAIALGVEPKWNKKFKDVLDATAIQDSAGSVNSGFGTGTNYGTVFGGGAFTSGFTNSLSTATTAPSSSGSGFSGGGSGGGGGGGGGGGW